MANINEVTDAFGDITERARDVFQTEDEIFLKVIPKGSAGKRGMCRRTTFLELNNFQIVDFSGESPLDRFEELGPGCPKIFQKYVSYFRSGHSLYK